MLATRYIFFADNVKRMVSFYRDVRSRGIDASEPRVGNGMWVTSMADPDGFNLYFQSVTDVPEETRLSEVA